MDFPSGSVVNSRPAKGVYWVTQVQFLDRENAREKGMATHSGILAWEILWTEEPGRLQSMGSQRVGQDLSTKQHQQQQASTCSVLC